MSSSWQILCCNTCIKIPSLRDLLLSLCSESVPQRTENLHFATTRDSLSGDVAPNKFTVFEEVESDASRSKKSRRSKKTNLSAVNINRHQFALNSSCLQLFVSAILCICGSSCLRLFVSANLCLRFFESVTLCVCNTLYLQLSVSATLWIFGSSNLQLSVSATFCIYNSLNLQHSVSATLRVCNCLKGAPFCMWNCLHFAILQW